MTHTLEDIFRQAARNGISIRVTFSRGDEPEDDEYVLFDNWNAVADIIHAYDNRPTPSGYPLYVPVDDGFDRTPPEQRTYRILQLTQGGTYRAVVGATWSIGDAVRIADSLNGYPKRDLP